MSRRARFFVLCLWTSIAVLIAGATPGAGQTEAQDGPPLVGMATGDGTAADDDGVLRVATYNVLHSQGDDADASMSVRIGLVADAIAADGADVAGLQEVTRSNNHGVVAERIAQGLAERTGDDWHWAFFQSNPHFAGEPDLGPGGIGGPSSQTIAMQARAGDSPWAEGVAIVSRWPLERVVVHRLPPRSFEIPFCDPTEPLCPLTLQFDTRTVMWGRVAAPCGPFDLFVSHLANNETSQSETARLIQVTDALAWMDGVAADDATPDFYVGDFNTLEGSPVHQAVLDAGFVDGYRAAEPDGDAVTSGQDIRSPTATAGRRIDYVFIRPGTEPIGPSDAAILGDAPAPFDDGVVWPSDHYGVAITAGLSAGCGSVTGAGATPTAPPTTAAAPILPVTGAQGGFVLALLAAGAGAVSLRLSARSGRR